MGAADVVPGVSGGTMAFILGIYAALIDAIKSFDREWLKSVLQFEIKHIFARPHFHFITPLFIGIISAVLFFTRIVPLPKLLIVYPEHIYGLFFGLIAGSIIVLVQELANMGWKMLVPISAGIVLGTLVFNLVPMQTPESSWFIFLAGCISICAMILPGISGSFVLLILNKYAYVFNAIGYFNFSVIIPFALGALTGLVIFSRILSYLLKRFYRNTLLLITGILIASLWIIWPFQQRIYETVRGKPRLIDSVPFFPPEMTQTVLSSFSMIITGFMIVFIVNWFATIKQKTAE